jgi:hypothetical protein
MERPGPTSLRPGNIAERAAAFCEFLKDLSALSAAVRGR